MYTVNLGNKDDSFIHSQQIVKLWSQLSDKRSFHSKPWSCVL